MCLEVGALAVDLVAAFEAADMNLLEGRRGPTDAGCGRRRRHDRFVRGGAHLRPSVADGPRGGRAHRLLRYPGQVCQYPGYHVHGRVREMRFLLVLDAVTAIRCAQRYRTAPIGVRVARSSVGHRHEAFGGEAHVFVHQQMHLHGDAGTTDSVHDVDDSRSTQLPRCHMNAGKKRAWLVPRKSDVKLYFR